MGRQADERPSRVTLPVRTLVVVWLFLVGATVASWWLSVTHGAALGSTVAVTVIVITAFAKIALIGAVYMDIRVSARWLRAASITWVLVVAAVILALALAGTP